MSIPLYAPNRNEIDSIIGQESGFSDGDETGVQRYIDAAALLAAGAVQFDDQPGRIPCWRVATHEVTANNCTCGSPAPECYHQLAVRLYLRIITARLRADIAAPFGVDVSCDGAAAVVITRQPEPEVVCAVLSTQRGWRPASVLDAVAYARHLAGGLGADQVTLDWVLTHASGDNLTLSFDVYYGGPMFFAGYHLLPAPWVKFDYDARQAMTPEAADALIRRHGWELASRPIKGAGLTHRYVLRRVPSNPADHAPGYSVASRTDAAVERAHMEQVAARIEGRTPQPSRARAQEL